VRLKLLGRARSISTSRHVEVDGRHRATTSTCPEVNRWRASGRTATWRRLLAWSGRRSEEHRGEVLLELCEGSLAVCEVLAREANGRVTILGVDTESCELELLLDASAGSSTTPDEESCCSWHDWHSKLVVVLLLCLLLATSVERECLASLCFDQSDRCLNCLWVECLNHEDRPTLRVLKGDVCSSVAHEPLHLEPLSADDETSIFAPNAVAEEVDGDIVTPKCCRHELGHLGTCGERVGVGAERHF